MAQISENEHGQVTKLQLCNCKAYQIKTFHITWITFWLCFFVWFCTTNIYSELSQDLTDLSLSQHYLAGSLSVTSTVLFRLIISHLCFKYGSKTSYLVILTCTALTLIAMSLVQSSVGYILCHVFLGISGASFVVTQYHTTRMFADKVVGSAQAMTAGFGNFGGGCANFIMPLLVHYTNLSWRWYMIIFAIILFIFCIVYYFGTSDVPQPRSASLMSIDVGFRPSTFPTPLPSSPLPDKQVGGSLEDAARDYRTWILFFCYAACFGVEITFYLVAAQYFQTEYGLNEILSGLIVIIWSSINIFARPLGGYFTDKYDMVKRVNILSAILFTESIFIILFGAIGHLSIYGAIISSLLFSMCVQMAEGVTFNIVPFIQPKSVGHVIGIVGSGGNFGATFFIFVIFIPWTYSTYDPGYSWIVLGVIVMIISFFTLRIRFTSRELRDLAQTAKARFDLETVKTSYKMRNHKSELSDKQKNTDDQKYPDDQY